MTKLIKMITIKELKIDNESGLKIIQLIKKHEPKIWETLKQELTQALNIPVVSGSASQKGDYYCLDCVDYPNTLTNDNRCSTCGGENIEWHNEDGTIEEI